MTTREYYLTQTESTIALRCNLNMRTIFFENVGIKNILIYTVNICRLDSIFAKYTFLKFISTTHFVDKTIENKL